jgi:hypothetical protein
MPGMMGDDLGVITRQNNPETRGNPWGIELRMIRESRIFRLF